MHCCDHDDHDRDGEELTPSPAGDLKWDRSSCGWSLDPPSLQRWSHWSSLLPLVVGIIMLGEHWPHPWSVLIVLTQWERGVERSVVRFDLSVKEPGNIWWWWRYVFCSNQIWWLYFNDSIIEYLRKTCILQSGSNYPQTRLAGSSEISEAVIENVNMYCICILYCCEMQEPDPDEYLVLSETPLQ